MTTSPLGFEIRARRAVLHACRLLRAVCGLEHASDEVTLGRLRHELACAREEIAILQTRLTRIEPRHRPRYTADQRFQILSFAERYGLSFTDAARAFVVDVGTIARWAAAIATDASVHPALVRPTPPVRRYADVVRHVVQLMDQMGFGGNRLIVATLARAGWRLSRETVRRTRHERPTPRTPGLVGRGPLVPRRPNHVWFLDLTTIPGAWRLWSWTLAVVLDGFARLPLAWRLFRQEPTADVVQGLLAEAVRNHGRPRVVVTDRGTQFTAAVFQRAVRSAHSAHRVGAIGRPGSIARLERFWRTLKAILDRRPLPPARFSTCETAIQSALVWYAGHRPHTAHERETPLERYVGARSQPLRAPPRARPGEASEPPPFTLTWLDPERTLPILHARAA